MIKPHLQRAVTAHRQSDEVCRTDREVVQYIDGVTHEVTETVRLRGRWDVRRDVTSSRIGNDAVAARKVAQLCFPTAVVAGKFMQEQDRRSASCLFVVQASAIARFREGHGIPSSLRCLQQLRSNKPMAPAKVRSMHQPVIRPMSKDDLDISDRVHRIAFGTRFGLPDPSKFRGDAELVRNRWAIDATTALVAELEGIIVGGACAMDWGSVFIVGPVFIRPDYAGRGIARLLMNRMVALADARGAALSGLFTFPESATHLRLYESFGFVPQALTPIMTKPPGSGSPRDYVLFSKVSADSRDSIFEQCRNVTDSVFPGLDLTREIEAIASLGLGDTILLGTSERVRGFALCHCGAGSEGGSGTLFIKFATVRPSAPEDFAVLLDGCEDYARVVGAERIAAGTNAARRGAYQIMRDRGFRAGLVGVAMHRLDGAGYNRPEVFAIDDWR